VHANIVTINDTIPRKWSLTIQAGATFGNFSTKSVNFTPAHENNFSFLPGFKVGVLADYKIAKNWFLTFGLSVDYLRVQNKFEQMQRADTLLKSTEEYRLTYINIPLQFSYKHSFSEKLAIKFNLGAYIAYGIVGNVTTENEYSVDSKIINTITETSDFFVDNTQQQLYYRIDSGLSAEISLIFSSKFKIGVGYYFGIKNYAFQPNWVGLGTTSSYAQKNHNIFITVGYMINKFGRD
jgi:hypothetical protein